jgi:glucosamine-6-phosphate deaminase
MHFVCLDDPPAVAEFVSRLLLEAASHPQPGAIALPTGKTPLPLYELLGRTAPEVFLRLKEISWFALDEFLSESLPLESSFRHFLLSRFVVPLGLDPHKLFTLNHAPEDPDVEGKAYEAMIHRLGGLRLALLGLGQNGHIGFNEPGTPLDSRSGARTLMERSRLANAYLFPGLEAVPTEAITMGIGTILDARQVVMMATGESKAQPVSRLLALSEPTPEFPASALLGHPNAWLIVDRLARPGM